MKVVEIMKVNEVSILRQIEEMASFPLDLVEETGNPMMVDEP